MPERQCQWCGKTYPFYEDHDSVECRDALREGITRLTRERDEAREKYEGAVNDWRNACALMNKAEAKLARCVEALEEGLLLTASWADVRTHNWRNEVRAALAAAKGE